MPIIASVLTTLGLSIVSGVIKLATDNDDITQPIIKGGLKVFDTLFDNVLCQTYDEQITKFKNLTAPEHNSDVERCSRLSLLNTLIIFSEVCITHIYDNDEYSPEDKKLFLFALKNAQKNMTGKLKKLEDLEDDAEVFTRNILTKGDILQATISNQDNTQRIADTKLLLTELAMTEFTYRPGHRLYQPLKKWLEEGIDISGETRHWFVYYVHQLHQNLKKDTPAYCKKARVILMLTQTSDILLLSKENFETTQSLFSLAKEMN